MHREHRVIRLRVLCNSVLAVRPRLTSSIPKRASPNIATDAMRERDRRSEETPFDTLKTKRIPCWQHRVDAATVICFMSASSQ